MAVDICKCFETLAERKYWENDLSDVTYALCQSDCVFKQFFLDFFFGSGTIGATNAKIAREVWYGSDRPDFTISVGNDLYLVEVKIWDRNHHFDQYGKILAEKGNCGLLGYISNYDIDVKVLSQGDQKAYQTYCQGGRTVKTWKQFVAQLEAYNCLNDSVVQAYVAYVKKVCPFDSYVLNLNDVFDAQNFADVKSIYGSLENAIGKAGCSVYTRKSGYASKYYMGFYFEWVDPNGQQVWGWYGVIFRGDKTVLCVEFEDRNGWGKPICDKYRNKLPFDDNSLRFCYESGSNALPTAQEIEDFLKNVLNDILNSTIHQANYKFLLNNVKYSGLKSVFLLKSLPIFLESYIWGLKLNNGYEIEPLNGGNFSMPEKLPDFCGRYFTIPDFSHTSNGSCINGKSVNEDTIDEGLISGGRISGGLTNVAPINGWLGVMFKTVNGQQIPLFAVEIDANRVVSNALSWLVDSNYPAWKYREVQAKTYGDLLNGIKNVLNDYLANWKK